MKLIISFILSILMINLASAEVKQGLLNKLLAPGPLIEGHKKLEKKDCLECHSAGSGTPDSKCLDCHKEIRENIKSNKKSFHANVKKDCFLCHSDHKGRDFNTTEVDEKKFDHKATGYELTGKHEKIKCNECHTEKREKKPIRKNETRYFGKTTSCKGCHQKSDVHLYTGKWKKLDCGKCHGTVDWKKEVKFDHTKDTKYKLVGKHQKLKCAECHLENPKGVDKDHPAKGKSIYKWKGLKQKKCLSCHDDFHGNKLSPKFKTKSCDTCHSQNEWKIKRFNHNVTNFKLKGAHFKTDCLKCHTSNLKTSHKNFQWTGLKKDCVSCHKDETHFFGNHKSKRYRNIKNCQACHNETDWKKDLDFNHNFDTRWKINGKHLKLKCSECHTPFNEKVKTSPRKYFWKDLNTKTCENCHKSPHLQTFSKKNLAKKCTSCHTTEGWTKHRQVSKGFNHNFDTQFPLKGKHTKIKCDDCHGKGEKKQYNFKFAEKQFCQACHKNVHEKQFHEKFADKSCAECHNSYKFTWPKNFDHNKTSFKLTGKHKKIGNKCTSCHIATKEWMPPTKGKKRKKAAKFIFKHEEKGFCNDCHQNVHENQFNDKFSEQACSECHTTNNFEKIKEFDHDKTEFKILGNHKKLKCSKCHTETKAWHPKRRGKRRHRKSQFLFKHLELKNCATCHKDVHKGEFGANCSSCHSETRKWKGTDDFHKNFNLEGVHFTLQCAECHTENRRLGGMGDQCLLCHQKDDTHHGALPDCAQCHKQQFWEQVSFKHALSSFPLRGAHRVLDCDACHTRGVFQGTPTECISCHLQEKQSVTFPNHNVGGFETCNECHNEFSFQNAQ